tara:strand:+ start:117 stop:1037 length:921 start_codon:yes stop_codon:yes gene_type:complete
MKPQFQHTLITSFYLWFDNYLQKYGEAYSNKTGIFYSMSDDRLDSTYNVYSSPYKQFVFDSGLNTGVVNYQGTEGALVIDRISGQTDGGVSVELPRNTSGLHIDYENGRVFFTGDANSNLPGNNLPLSGRFAVKDFNLYVTNETEEDLVIDKFKTNDRFGNLQTSGVAPYDQVLPAVFISSESIQNQPFAFGGLDITKTNVKAVVMTSDLYCLDCVLSLAADAQKRSFVNVEFSDFPITEFGDIKTATYPTGYSYNEVESNNTKELFHIEEVTVSKLSDRVKKKVNPNIFIGFIDFELHKYRSPRA